jgi:predicted glycogen debranching enzyme
MRDNAMTATRRQRPPSTRIAPAPETAPTGDRPSELLEWLETDGLGGFAMGTTSGIRTRRYHGLLIAATSPPAGRTMLLNGVEAWVRTPNGDFPLTTQRYVPDVVQPRGEDLIAGFSLDPWPQWTYALPDGTRIRHELFLSRGDAPRLVLSWRALPHRAEVTLFVRPLLSGRDYHALHHENSTFDFTPSVRGDVVSWRPYASLPHIALRSNGRYRHAPEWYRQFLYTQERARGFDCVEDLASPGVLEFDLSAGEACALASAAREEAAHEPDESAEPFAARLRERERRRRELLGSPLDQAADAYLVARNSGRSIIAGYPWFGDWGRDTFIAMRGLCLPTGRLDEARRILLAWADTISDGMVPNRFNDDADGGPEFNSVDASLWYVIAIHEFLRHAPMSNHPLVDVDRAALRSAVLEIVRRYAAGTRYRIGMTDDGLLAAGEKGQQLTWMDARVAGREVTPRIGKPVEVNALWVNACWIAAQFDASFEAAYTRAITSFRDRFWSEEFGGLFDVIDAGHRRGENDPTIRPNQIFAVGGLPVQIMTGERAAQIVERVERHLWTPIGLRTLAPDEAEYEARYAGGPEERDRAYHQGAAWPWLLGPFVEAWVRVRGCTPGAKSEARRRFLAPLMDHVMTAGVGHVSEVADGDSAGERQNCGGCPFQAWSLGELIRLDRVVLSETEAAPSSAEARRERAR